MFRPWTLLSLVLLLWPGSSPAASDPEAVAVAQRCLAAMGGAEAWEQTRFVSWKFFGKRQHYWDRYTGRVRIETEDTVILMNIGTGEGSVVTGSQPLTGEELATALTRGFGMWTNDSYWVFMPYKLLDPGVQLTALGAGQSEDGRAAQVIALSFEGVGLTPDNRYHVWVDDETGLVSQWSYYPSAEETEPSFVSPWNDWRKVGQIMLCGDHGRGLDWELAVHPSLPDAVFESAEPVNLE